MASALKKYDIVIASGAEHLGLRFKEHGYNVYRCAPNYDNERIFPNGDIYVRIPRIERLSDRNVLVLQSCTASGPDESERFSTSDRLVELLLILDVLRNPAEIEQIDHKTYCSKPVKSPKRIDVVLTFQPFGLQDKAFKTGEAVSARWAMCEVAKLADKIHVVNPHAPESLDWMQDLIDEGKLSIVDVTEELVLFAARQFEFDDYIVVAPDEGGQERFECAGFGKSRENSFKVELYGDLDVIDKNVIVIDDLTKSGSTLMKAADRLRKQDAKEVGLAVVHVLPLIDRGEELLENLVEKSDGNVVVTNTIRTHEFCVKNPELTMNIVDILVKLIK